jgi:hypothetical protein
MKKTKPTYTAPEIKNLYNSLKMLDHLNDQEIIDALETFIRHNPDEETRKFIDENDKEQSRFLEEMKGIEAYEELAAEASALESQARAIRSTVKAFKCPVEDLPTKINNENKTIATIAAWRLSLGR